MAERRARRALDVAAVHRAVTFPIVSKKFRGAVSERFRAFGIERERWMCERARLTRVARRLQ